MIWQDYYLLLAGFILAASLIPAIRHKRAKPPRSTCLIEGLAVTGIAICYLTFALMGRAGWWLGFAGVVLNALSWYIILFQKRRKR